MDVNFFSRGRSVYNRAKHEGAERLLSQALKVLAHSPDSNYQRLAQAFGKLAKSKQQAMVADWFKSYLEPGGPGVQYFNRLTRTSIPMCARTILQRRWSGFSSATPRFP